MQGSHWSWKTLEFCVEKFKALESPWKCSRSWKVLEFWILVSRSNFFVNPNCQKFIACKNLIGSLLVLCYSVDQGLVWHAYVGVYVWCDIITANESLEFWSWKMSFESWKSPGIFFPKTSGYPVIGLAELKTEVFVSLSGYVSAGSIVAIILLIWIS